jgi:hypothetical protein
MLAKIGYATAVRGWGLDSLPREDVCVLDAILGTKDDVGMWVGCVEENIIKGETAQFVGVIRKDGFIHAVIKLFAWLETVQSTTLLWARYRKNTTSKRSKIHENYYAGACHYG